MKRDNSKRLVLVTGGAGYKGSTMCRELLGAGYRVRVLDNLMYGGNSLVGLLNHPNLEFRKGDVTKAEDVNAAMHCVTDVIHLAAIVGDKPCEKNPRLSIEVNYKATQLLAERARAKKVGHFIFASTCSNYGIMNTSIPADEFRELNPVSLYAETKIDCERYLVNLSKKGDFFPAVLRCSSTYGVSGRTRFDLTVNSLTFEALRDKRIIVFSEYTWRPFTHVLDLCRIYCKLLELPLDGISGEIFNAGWNEHNYTKKEVVEMIKEVIGGLEVDFVNTIEDKRSYRVDFTKIKKVLNFSPVMTIPDGVRELCQAIRAGILTEQDFEDNRLK